MNSAAIIYVKISSVKSTFGGISTTFQEDIVAMVSVTRQKPPSVSSKNNTGSGSVPPKDTPKGKFPPFLRHFKASAATDVVVYKVGNTKECDGVNLTVRVNPTKRENQRAKLERYFPECVS